MKRYEFIDHTADVAVKAYGDSLEEAFASAAEAMFDVITGSAAIEAARKIEFGVESIDPEGLLVMFLSQLIVIHEVEGLVLTDFAVSFAGEHKLQATGRGEKFDRQKHGGGIQVKGVSYHMMEISRPGEGRPCFVQVLFDI